MTHRHAEFTYIPIDRVLDSRTMVGAYAKCYLRVRALGYAVVEALPASLRRWFALPLA